jgi:glutathione S-transferase
VPVMTDGDHQFFESGGILLHWSRKDVRLLPTEYPARLCVINWLLGAFNSFEPFTIQTATVDIFAKDEECAKLRRPDTRRLCYAL